MTFDNKSIEQIKNFIREELKKPESSLNSILEAVKTKFKFDPKNIWIQMFMTQIEKIITDILQEVSHEKETCKPETKHDFDVEVDMEQPNPYVINTTPVEDNRYEIKFFVPGIPKDELILNHSKQYLTLRHLHAATDDNTDYLLKAHVPIDATVEGSVYANGVLSVTIQLPTEKNIPIL
jgi:HSP20 family molecular chaperone IbpA